MKLSNSFYCRACAAMVLALVVVAQLLSSAGADTAPAHLLVRFFYFPAGWSVTIFLLIVLSMRDRAILVGWMACCASLGAVAGTVWASADGGVLDGVVVGLGLSPYLFALWRIANAPSDRRSEWIDLLAVASLIHISALAIPFFRDQTAQWLPSIVDLRIARLDEAFGAQPSSAMAKVFTAWPPLHTLSLAAYAFVQLPIVIVAAFHWKRKKAGEVSILPAFIIGSLIGFTCYWLTPAIGPKAYFGADFPLMHATAGYLANRPLFDFNFAHPRNAMPSMHISWAVLVFLYTRGFPLWARCYAGAFVFLTACATLGLGEHYLMDLVVAAPLVLLVRSLWATGLGWADAARRNGVVAGLGLLAFWIETIRAGVEIAPPAALLLITVTVGASALLEHALAGVERVRARRDAAAAPLPAGALISLR